VFDLRSLAPVSCVHDFEAGALRGAARRSLLQTTKSGSRNDPTELADWAENADAQQIVTPMLHILAIGWTPNRSSSGAGISLCEQRRAWTRRSIFTRRQGFSKLETHPAYPEQTIGVAHTRCRAAPPVSRYMVLTKEIMPDMARWGGSNGPAMIIAYCAGHYLRWTVAGI
jgi:hypothetical protein